MTTSRALMSMLFASCLLAPFPSFASIARCSEPPGPPGEVRCRPDDMAMCDATGHETLGQCLERPKGGVREQQRAILGAILKHPPSDAELKQWSAALATGVVRRGGSVFTFDLGEGGSEDDDKSSYSRVLSLVRTPLLVLGGILLVINQAHYLWMNILLRRRRANVISSEEQESKTLRPS